MCACVYREVAYNVAPCQLVRELSFYHYTSNIIAMVMIILLKIPIPIMYVGYLGSSLIGALLIFCGFDSKASMVAAIALGVLLLVVLFWARNWLTRILTIVFAGIIVGLWFTPDHVGLKYFVLFVG